MSVFSRICFGLLVAGGIGWGLVGLFQFDAAGWLLGGTASVPCRVLQGAVGVAALCSVPALFAPAEADGGADRPEEPGR